MSRKESDYTAVYKAAFSYWFGDTIEQILNDIEIGEDQLHESLRELVGMFGCPDMPKLEQLLAELDWREHIRSVL